MGERDMKLLKLTAIVAIALGLASPVVAHHKDDHDKGKSSAPGQLAKEEGAEDVNEDSKVNGKDFAPGQQPEAE